MTRKTRSAAINRHPMFNARSTKTPSAELVLLEVEADDCPQVLLRVLGLAARDSTIPVTIEAARLEDGIAIAIELDGITASASELVAYRIAGFPTVRKVTLAGRQVALGAKGP